MRTVLLGISLSLLACNTGPALEFGPESVGINDYQPTSAATWEGGLLLGEMPEEHTDEMLVLLDDYRAA